MRSFMYVVLGLASLALAGCKGGGDAKITGTVKYKGNPVCSGYVLLKFDNENEVNGAISSDGTFAIHTAFTGHAKIAVGSPKPSKVVTERRGGAPADVSKVPDPALWVEIPAKYADPNTSGKEATIKGGDTINIELE